MRDQRGLRVVELDLWDGLAPPDLADFPTAGAILGLIDETGRLSDVVKQGPTWIVAVVQPDDELQGYAGDTLGEAAAWAFVYLWEALEGEEPSS
jgi:hypothetical protein